MNSGWKPLYRPHCWPKIIEIDPYWLPTYYTCINLMDMHMNTFSYNWFKCSKFRCSNEVFSKCPMGYTFGTFDKCSNEVFWKCFVGYTFGTFHGYNFGTFSKCSESVFHGTFSEHSKKCSRNILGTSYATKLGVSFKHSQNVPVDHFWNIPSEHSENVLVVQFLNIW